MKRMGTIRSRCDIKNYNKIKKIGNKFLINFITDIVEILKPDSIFMCSDTDDDFDYIREKAIKDNEESKLLINGHTVHFDGEKDQARDKRMTKFLVENDSELGKGFNTLNRDEGLEETLNIMSGIMKGKELLILLFTLGPADSEFTIPAVQLTDSSYVAHSEIILYRPGYEEFRRKGDFKGFFKFVHSEGELENNVSKNVDKRRIYIDTQEDTVYSMNTQYGGNTIGLKKLAMRLAIYRAYKEDWLTEHMFIAGIHGPSDRVTYFAGAFPSMCGKTSTAMLKGETIIGDDIAYIKNKDGVARAVNAEIGIFGIIKDINPDDDPMIWKVLNVENEIIFSNVLKTDDGNVFWIGKPVEVPERGINYTGEWWPGKKDEMGNEIPPSHKNARFTISLKDMENLDPGYNNTEGVKIGGIIYGGRDSDTWVPVLEAYNWTHGIVTMGAAIESETTAATLGKTGVRTFNPMSNMDFLSVPLGVYIDMNIRFGEGLDECPHIFSVNYFLKDKEGSKFLNSKLDKIVWIKWMELRVNNESNGIDIGIGYIPEYKDLKILFKKYPGKDYNIEDYINQFTLRIPENLAKIKRIIDIYRDSGPGVPKKLFDILESQKKKLESIRDEKGDYISPEDF
jgi:phosphoenolpyruvate carboxykinase (GTP)